MKISKYPSPRNYLSTPDPFPSFRIPPPSLYNHPHFSPLPLPPTFTRTNTNAKHLQFETKANKKKMGFPVGYTDLFLPKLLVYLLTVLGFVRKFVYGLLSLLGLGDFLEPETASYASREESGPELRSVSAALIRELLPVVKFSDLEEDLDPPESCAVCLYEFGGEDEIRRLTNCRHIFHRSCVDRWMDHDQKTCPLCRTQFIPEDMQEVFNERLWLASGISDFYGDYSPITTGL